MSVFYLFKKNSTIVEEIRRIVKFDGVTKYIIDRKGGKVNFVSKEEFVFIPPNFRLLKIK